MRQNITIQRPPTVDEIAARVALFEQSQRDADRINAKLVLGGAQQREFERQSALVEKTQLSVEHLVAIRE